MKSVPKWQTGHSNPQGKRERERPRNSWRRSTVREAGKSWSELRYLAADREKRKKLVDDLCP
jgi:hypothetical protein